MKKQILVIDEDNSIRNSLKRMLEGSGHAVVLAEDGEAGAARLEQEKFDLLILDLNLPKLSGFDILDLAMARHAMLPVIILTGLRDQCVPGALAGADAVLEKPAEPGQLLRTVEKLLGESADARLGRVSEALRRTRVIPPVNDSYLCLPKMFHGSQGEVQPGDRMQSLP